MRFMVGRRLIFCPECLTMSHKKAAAPKNASIVPPDIALPDPAEISAAMARIAERSQKLIVEFAERQEQSETPFYLDPMNLGSAFMDLTNRLMADPTYLIKAQMGLWQSYANLWQHATRKFLGEETTPVAAPNRDDRRFKDPAWEESPFFDYIKQSYLLTARWLQDTVRKVDGLDPREHQKLEFYTRQFVDAMAPSNFIATNPEVLRETIESGGENLLRGLENMLQDIERGDGNLRISMTDEHAFKVGDNIAVTPGKVIYQNDLAQLIQYTPTTEKVFKTPLLIIPPWINKFYILDLKPENSFIQWALNQGHSVFVVSWVNPDAKLAEKSFEDYMREGIFAMLDVIEKATGEKKINAIGYCLGGTLLASSLAVMAKRKDDRIASATFLTTLLDFSEAGEITVFIDEEQLAALESKLNRQGYLEADAMHKTFNLLRANDLIWSFVVNNYLLGKDPFPFDLLYWNSDSTRMPSAMHIYYLRNMYQNNNLIKPDALTLDGVPVDLTKITTPAFFLSAREDHIAPWKSTFRVQDFYKGDLTFVLAASGHIAGVVNPPVKNKYCYWTNSTRTKDADEWLHGAKQHDGSWWPAWQEWIAPRSGAKIPARQPGTHTQILEDAPGTYVKVKTL